MDTTSQAQWRATRNVAGEVRVTADLVSLIDEFRGPAESYESTVCRVIRRGISEMRRERALLDVSGATGHWLDR